ncbi:hypothetical protein B0H10DRAFT_1943513 [Mycena sp. CBHHK59/15]|nr:hypothetical protein B0H10DRAFT_1943513 [Mycena sp. CBHHK59/15]
MSSTNSHPSETVHGHCLHSETACQVYGLVLIVIHLISVLRIAPMDSSFKLHSCYSSMLNPPPYDAWSHTPNGTIVLASNTKVVPNLPFWNDALQESPMPRIDGRWGMSEYLSVPQPYDASSPYLAWLPTHNFRRIGMPTDINSFDITEDPKTPNTIFVRHPGWKHWGHLNTELREKLQQDVIFYIDQVDTIIVKLSKDSPAFWSNYSHVQLPVIALVYAHNSAFCMRFPHLTYRDLLEYLAGLQRAVSELQAFIMWYDRIQYADIPSNSCGFELGLRGSIANTCEEYNLLRRLGVPVWLQLATSDLLVPDPQKETTCLSLHVETRLWSGMPVSISLKDIHKGKLVHNKPLEYYPPCVKEPRQYESAARGYSVRFDIFNRDLKSADDVLEMVRSTNPTGVNHNVSSSLAHRVRETGSTAAELMEQYASDRAVAPVMDADKNSPALIGCPGEKSKWYRQYIEICKSHNVSLWAPKHTEAWNMGSHNTYYPLHHDIQLIPKCKDLLLFVAPPPHLFLGIKKADKLNMFFFIWMCIRRPWLSRVHRDDGDPISWGLTTQKWREILGGYYWKLRHPKELDPVPFTLRRFWRHGGPLIFGNEAEDVGRLISHR